MPVIVRDAVASDHLVYAWPFPIGPEECDVSCAEDELVIMCPAWLVGDRLGPGRHRWRSPDPSRPVSAYFVLTAPVEVSFDCMTQFMIPTTGQHVRIRAQGSLQVRCMDPALLIAQFVGLPFDAVNDGVLRSVSRSIERMLARLLTRRVVMAGTPAAVTDPNMLSNIIEELVAYNPTAGAVFGVELMRFGHLAVVADDGTRPWQQMIMSNGDGAGAATHRHQTHPLSQADIQIEPDPVAPPAPPPAKARAQAGTLPPPVPQPMKKRDSQPNIASGEIGAKSPRAPTPQPTEVSGEIGGPKPRPTPPSQTAVSGEIGGSVPKPRPTPPSQPAVSGEIGGGVAKPSPTPPSQPAVSGESARPWAAPTSPSGWAAPTTPDAQPPAVVSGEIASKPTPAAKKTTLGVAVSDPAIPLPKPPTQTPTGSQPGATRPTVPSIPPIPATPKPGARKPEIQVAEEPTHPGIDMNKPLPGAPGAALSSASSSGKIEAQGTPAPQVDSGHDSRGSILGIGVAHIGSSGTASGEISKKIAPGGRVLVPGPNGLMQSATVRQLLQGYYELEVGGSGETIWVPVNGVVPE